MEQQTKKSSKNKLLKFLPKAASAVSFQNHPSFNPGSTDKRLPQPADHFVISGNKAKTHAGRGFSGPVISMIPAEARLKPSKNLSFEPQEEPTSPKISCIGKIKHRRKARKTINAKINRPFSSPPEVGNKKRSSILDWTKKAETQIAPADYSDEESVIIAYSAPIPGSSSVRGRDAELSLQPRKEINIWKRRTMAQPPPPLQLNTECRSN